MRMTFGGKGRLTAAFFLGIAVLVVRSAGIIVALRQLRPQWLTKPKKEALKR